MCNFLTFLNFSKLPKTCFFGSVLVFYRVRAVTTLTVHSVEPCGRSNILAQHLLKTMLGVAYKTII